MFSFVFNNRLVENVFCIEINILKKNQRIFISYPAHLSLESGVVGK